MTSPFERARTLVGCPFRPHGRSPEIGVDCVGVAIIAYQLQDVAFPHYRYSEGRFEFLEDHLEPHFRRISVDSANVGDLVVTRGPRCLHFAVQGPATFVHADLRALRVVETPGVPFAVAGVRTYRFNQEKT